MAKTVPSRAARATIARRVEPPQPAQITDTAPGVMTAMERLHLCLDDLESALGALHARLAPVLTPANGVSTEEPLPPASLRSPLADSVHAECDRIYLMSVGLRRSLEALEV